MTRPERIDPERTEQLVDGAAPVGDDERALVALMDAARALEPAAPDTLRERVLAGARGVEEADAAEAGAHQPATGADRAGPRRGALDPRRWLGDAGERRRRLLVAAPVTAALVAVLVAIPAFRGGEGTDATSPLPEAYTQPADSASRLQGAAPGGDADAAGAAPAEAAPAPPPVPVPGRLQVVTARTRVQVDDVAALSRASTSAMRTARGLGGFTARSRYGVPDAGRGSNELVMRVPVGRVEEALTAFGRLGVVVAQSADIVDVTDRVASADRGVARLRERLAGLRAQAAADPADVALARRVVRAEAALQRAETAAAAQRSRARLATVTLTLTTEGPPPPAEEEGRFAGPIADAGDRLAGALAWLLGALVLVSPFAALAALAAWAARRLRLRSARRLMGST